MRSFNENLSTYHALKRLGDFRIASSTRKMLEAPTQEDLEAIMKDTEVFFERQAKAYEELGNEMAQIMEKP